MLPCLNKDALKLLVGTADERYAFSEEYFRNTHFPQVMHRYQGNQLIAEITEHELFEELLEVDSACNRIYFIFGAAGSGKSELLCWLKDQWSLNKIDRPVIRISRSELNPQVLIKKCFEELNIPIVTNIDHNRWALLLKKPITIVNQIVWTTLAESLESDDEIVPFALLIRPMIEKNIIEFITQVQRGRIRKPLEVLHRHQYDHLVASTTINMPLDYPLLRQTLSQKLDQYLFEGWDVASLFTHLSSIIKESRIRPLLLIDDLVQSVNIYATDLLDQLITLEEGNWDVVIGLTPSAVQDSDKGFDLTKRIQSLDTIDDRVKKYWLSDESGKEFYSLDRSHVVQYMQNYLQQLKGTQGFTCSVNCRYYNNCSEIDSDVALLPFNRHMVKRIFDAIPFGKGRLRYIILHSKELIRFFLRGRRDHLARVMPLVKREKFAEHSDFLVKTFAEWYVPEDLNESIVSHQMLHHFGYDLEDMTIMLQPLTENFHMSIEQQIPVTEMDAFNNAEMESVRDWVEGKQINLELLEPVKLGVSTLVHDVVKGVNMSRRFTPKTSATIQRKEITNRTRYPISLDHPIHDEKRINVSRCYAALLISNFQQLKSKEKVGVFQKISNDFETAKWFYQTEKVHDTWQEKLEHALGVSISTFAYRFKIWVDTCMAVSHSTWASDVEHSSPFTSDLRFISDQCYQDWFMLRENLYQPIDSKRTQFEFDQWLRHYSPGKELEHYQIGEVSLYVFITQLKERYKHYCDLLDDSLKKTLSKRMMMVPFLLGSENQQFQKIAAQIKHFCEKTSFFVQDYFQFTDLESEVKLLDLGEQFANAEAHYKEAHLLKKQFHTLIEDIRIYFDGSERSSIENDSISWSKLMTTREKFTVLIEETAAFKDCLSQTHWKAANSIIHSGVESHEVVNVQTIWNRMMEFANQILQQQPVGLELFKIIDEWQSIDFYYLENLVATIARQEVIKANVMKILKRHLETNEIDNLRPMLKRQIKLLLEQGYSILPPVQWKRMLEELKEKFPDIFEVVEIRLVVSEKNN